MEENEKGNYTHARELCDTVISMPEAEDIQKATAHFVAAVCATRLGEAESAEFHLEAFDALKEALPPDHQTLKEEEFLRRDLRKIQ